MDTVTSNWMLTPIFAACSVADNFEIGILGHMIVGFIGSVAVN